MDASFEPTLNLLSAYTIFNRKYGISVSEDDFIEEAYHAFKDINSIPVRNYYSVQKPSNADSMTIQVPCNLYKLISVTGSPAHEDGYKDIEPYTELRNDRDGKVSNYNILTGNSDMRTYHFDDKPYTGLGTYLQYEWVDEMTIKIADQRLWDTEIHLVYEGIAMDEDGLPLITRKHAVAIAAKVALTYATRKMFQGDMLMANVLPTIKAESDRLVQAAAIPESITDNQLDEMLNEMTSFDRKRYNRSFKFRRG